MDINFEELTHQVYEPANCHTDAVNRYLKPVYDPVWSGA